MEGVALFRSCSSQHIVKVTIEAEQMPGKCSFFHPKLIPPLKTPRRFWPDNHLTHIVKYTLTNVLMCMQTY